MRIPLVENREEPPELYQEVVRSWKEGTVRDDSRSDSQNNSQMLCAITVGYALLLMFFGLFTGRVNLLFFGEHAEAVFPAYAHAAELGQIACLFAFALLAFFHQKYAERLTPLAALVFFVAGYALTLYQVMGAGTRQFLPDIAGALFGCGQGACFLCWLSIFVRLSPATR